MSTLPTTPTRPRDLRPGMVVRTTMLARDEAGDVTDRVVEQTVDTVESLGGGRYRVRYTDGTKEVARTRGGQALDVVQPATAAQ